MYKSEWGLKFICPDCSSKFYSLGKAEKLSCPECGAAYNIEANRKLKNNQPMRTAANPPRPLLDDEVAVAKAKMDEEKTGEDSNESDIFVDDDTQAEKTDAGAEIAKTTETAEKPLETSDKS